MIKHKKLKLILSSLIVILPVLAGLILWNQLPDKIVTHWSFDGTPDGFSSKTFTIFGLPLILLALHLFCIFITFLDPKNEMQTKTVFNLVIWLTPIVSIFANGTIYLGAFGISIPMQIWGSIFSGFIFIIVGSYLPKCKQNYTIGIKLPWTLNDETNWNATHKFSGKFWILGGILMFACGFVSANIFVWMFFGIISLMILIPFIYSYMYYMKNK